VPSPVQTELPENKASMKDGWTYVSMWHGVKEEDRAALRVYGVSQEEASKVARWLFKDATYDKFIWLVNKHNKEVNKQLHRLSFGTIVGGAQEWAN
jgi:hypothetical protein